MQDSNPDIDPCATCATSRVPNPQTTFAAARVGCFLGWGIHDLRGDCAWSRVAVALARWTLV